MHTFSIEVNHRDSVKEFSIRAENRALIEGELGERIEVEVVEGILLQITGDKGVLRLDLTEGDWEKFRCTPKSGENKLRY